MGFRTASKGQFFALVVAATNNGFEYIVSLTAGYHAEDCFLHDIAVGKRLLLYFTESQIHMVLYFIQCWATS